MIRHQVNAAESRPRRFRWIFPPIVAGFVVVLAIAMGILDTARPLTFGHDFLPSYAAGKMILDGQGAGLYDPQSYQSAAGQVQVKANLLIDVAHTPWLNPPGFALIFVPLAKLPYRAALLVWMAISLTALLASMQAIISWLPQRRVMKIGFFLAILTSCPLLIAWEHQQNTFLSLAIVTAAAAAWRTRHTFCAGLLAGLLAYKPQLAAVLGLALFLVEGRTALAGLLLSGLGVIAIGEIAAPGATARFVLAMPAKVAQIQSHPGYNWGRQVTPTAFFRAFSNARTAAFAGGATSLLAIALLSRWAWGNREAGRLPVAGSSLPTQPPGLVRNRCPDALDHVISLAILAIPLTAPYLMEYDLLLLAVPAALLLRRSPTISTCVCWLLVWVLAYANVDLSARAGINGVPVIMSYLFILNCLPVIGRQPALHSPSFTRIASSNMSSGSPCAASDAESLPIVR